MKSQYLATIAIAAFAAGAGFAVHSVRTQAEYCPPPSAASVTALFAPCQTFDTAMGRTVSKPEAVQMGLLTPDERPSPPATQLAASDRALTNGKVATTHTDPVTVGVAIARH